MQWPPHTEEYNLHFVCLPQLGIGIYAMIKKISAILKWPVQLVRYRELGSWVIMVCKLRYAVAICQKY